jgi:uncharacterized protein YggE
MRLRYIILAVVLSIAVLGLAGCETLAPPSSTTKAQSASGALISLQNNGIWVSGEGKVSVVPDVAILSLGVEVQSESVAEAQGYASTVMTSVLDELDKAGVAEKDIQTQQFNIFPIRRWSEKDAREVLIGYRVTNVVSAKVRNVDDTGNVIDAVAQAGGDFIKINSISFTVDNPSAYREEARELAMADARAKAEQLADLGNVRLGSPTYISESGVSVPAVREFFAGAPVPAPAVAPTPISPGETEIRLSVQVAYSID